MQPTTTDRRSAAIRSGAALQPQPRAENSDRLDQINELLEDLADDPVALSQIAAAANARLLKLALR